MHSRLNSKTISININKQNKNSVYTLDMYMEDPNSFEIISNGKIVKKKELSVAQHNFRENYDKVREFFD